LKKELVLLGQHTLLYLEATDKNNKLLLRKKAIVALLETERARTPQTTDSSLLQYGVIADLIDAGPDFDSRTFAATVLLEEYSDGKLYPCVPIKVRALRTETLAAVGTLDVATLRADFQERTDQFKCALSQETIAQVRPDPLPSSLPPTHTHTLDRPAGLRG
jgi:hypothetical protein